MNEEAIAAELQEAIHKLIGDYAKRERNIRIKDVFIRGALKALSWEMAGLIMASYTMEGWPKMVNALVKDITNIVRSNHERLQKASPILKV